MSKIQYDLYIEDINTASDKSIHIDFELLTSHLAEDGTELSSMTIPLSVNMTDELEFMLEVDDEEMLDDNIKTLELLRDKLNTLVSTLRLRSSK